MGKGREVISLFSGAGGLDIGFKQAGFNIAVAVEQDPSCCNTLRLNNPDLTVVEGDVSKISTVDILKAANLAPLEAALVIGGPPCQSFSLAGKRMGMDDERGMLILEFSRVIHEALPKAFVMENVKGMLNWEKGRALEAILNEFKEPVIFEGNEYHYEVSYQVLNAVSYGVPQRRERLFIVGNRIDKSFTFPAPTHGTIKELDLLSPQLQPYKTAWDAFGDLPPADEPSEAAKRVSKSIKGRIEKHGY
ncbi:DNA cytosine methyltransferase [Vibrio lentus]|uniref:DNA cytosine methyltransferase n=1 Tax=Vibrio lentus TaxID=136468 RepID=UPI002479C01F|nr:DNA (cytosine-5-)-methyltransferase [Vibrio lentus]WGS60841.1 DNA (cytosine-5-)-methyltransferase [Vibrio lentus]